MLFGKKDIIKSKEINEAYKILYDDILREKYYSEYLMYMEYGHEQDDTKDEQRKDSRRHKEGEYDCFR